MAVKQVDVSTLRDALASPSPPLLVDVRSAGEFAGGHVPGAVNLPLSGFAQRVAEVAAGRELWLICRSGSRSASAASAAAAAGVKSVVDVQGGTMAWRASGGAVERHRSLSVFVFPVLASLTLGLAPLAPEPHLVGKLRWVFGGAAGMGIQDWFDLAMHGAPWLWLLRTAWLQIFASPRQ